MLLTILYAFILTASLVASLCLRFDFDVQPEHWQRFYHALWWVLPLKLVLLALYGQYRSMLTYFGMPDVKRLGQVMVLGALAQMLVWHLNPDFAVGSRGVILTDLIISFLGFSVLRASLRLYRERIAQHRVSMTGTKQRRVGIVGAGTSGSALFREIHSKPGLGLDVVCFVDDDPSKVGSSMHGRPVLGPRSRMPEIVRAYELQKMIIAIPTAGPAVIRETVQILNQIGIDHDILPSVTQLLHRQVTVSHLRHVDPVDLLGRDPVPLDEQGLEQLIAGHPVLVTGAGGSIGSELCRQLASYHPSRLVLVERSEPALFAIEQELIRDFPALAIDPMAASVTNPARLEAIFASIRPALVFHAAAHKHVPLMESQPGEAIYNNVIGTEIVAKLAARYGARKCVLVSSDKAVNPTNVMGATKRVAEMIMAQSHREAGESCAFSAVRFGNVLGSSQADHRGRACDSHAP